MPLVKGCLSDYMYTLPALFTVIDISALVQSKDMYESALRGSRVESINARETWPLLRTEMAGG